MTSAQACANGELLEPVLDAALDEAAAKICAEIKVKRAFLMDFFCARRDACVAMDTWSKFWRISAPACKMVDFGTASNAS